MIEDDFRDFFDSEDDAFFVEASNSLSACDGASSESLLPQTSISVSNGKKSYGCLDLQEINTSTQEKLETESNLEATIVEVNFCKDSKVVSPNFSKFDSPKVISSVDNNTLICDKSSYINNRLTPGFTPRTKKRKFAGPAGLLECFDETYEEPSHLSGSKKILSMDSEVEHIVSSQFSLEHLSLTSWQKLQTDVSSHLNLHSMAKFYSIQWVLHESSKKKLPKHVVVPVLCVLLKELKNKGSSAVPIFMDDTDEISGKIDAEVLSKYKEYMVEGTALILKKVTFLCNVLILKLDNLVSMYIADGPVKHLQCLESILDTPKPLKPMSECLKFQRHNGNNSISTAPGNSDPHKNGCVDYTPKRINIATNERHVLKKSIPSIKSSPSVINKQTSTPAKSVKGDRFLEDLISEDNCMDEFDELLGNMDDSFMEEL